MFKPSTIRATTSQLQSPMFNLVRVELPTRTTLRIFPLKLTQSHITHNTPRSGIKRLKTKLSLLRTKLRLRRIPESQRREPDKELSNLMPKERLLLKLRPRESLKRKLRLPSKQSRKLRKRRATPLLTSLSFTKILRM